MLNQNASILLSYQGPPTTRYSSPTLTFDNLSTLLMCTEHTSECPVCGKEYLVYVKFCPDFHPPLLRCPRGTAVERGGMQEGRCPSPVCPYSRTGGCTVS
ncbi:hypothetical protein F5Y15DRAFT_370042 [Xylariaceae sp. FL0016]|nr:hypothetical protein F5Y15DRAFT_370042 [Xylariaceae sp. FL0016]